MSKGERIRFREELTTLLYLPVNNSGVREKFLSEGQGRSVGVAGKGTVLKWLVR